MIKKIFFTLLLAFFSHHLFSQTINFGVYYKDKEIGKITANKKKDGKYIRYNVDSEVEYDSWLYHYQRTTLLSATYYKGKLYSCTAKVTEDGDQEVYRTTIMKNGIYECFSYPDKNFDITYSIPVSSAILYFREPVNIKELFLEGYQEMCELQHLGNHTYKLLLPGGKTNTYIYKDGKLIEVQVPRMWFTIHFRRK